MAAFVNIMTPRLHELLSCHTTKQKLRFRVVIGWRRHGEHIISGWTFMTLDLSFRRTSSGTGTTGSRNAMIINQQTTKY